MKFKLLTLFLIFLPFFSGCASIEEMFAKQRLATWAKADQQLVTPLYTVTGDGQEQVSRVVGQAGYRHGSFSATRISFDKEVASGRNVDMAWAEFTRNFPNVLDNPIVQVYVSTVQKRGNEARLYQAKFADHVTRQLSNPMVHFKGDSKNPASIERFDLQPLIIEVAHDGRLISALSHTYQIQASFGAGVTEFISIHYGDEMTRLGHRFSQRSLSQSFIRTL